VHKVGKFRKPLYLQSGL